MKTLTKEEMDANMKEVMDDWDVRTVDDEEFSKAVLIIGEWLSANFMKVGYKRLCRLILSEYKATMPKKKHGRGFNSSVKSIRSIKNGNVATTLQ
jgi:hypothetical protein